MADYSKDWQEVNRRLAAGAPSEDSTFERMASTLERMERLLRAADEAPDPSLSRVQPGSYRTFEDQSTVGRPSSDFNDKDDEYFASLLSTDL